LSKNIILYLRQARVLHWEVANYSYVLPHFYTFSTVSTVRVSGGGGAGKARDNQRQLRWQVNVDFRAL
jgi:hypothetical protein